MSGCNNPACIEVKNFVDEWVKTYQPGTTFLVSEEQSTTDIFIIVESIPKSEQLLLKGQQMKSLDLATQNTIKKFLYGKKIFKALFDAVKEAAWEDDGIDVEITDDGEFQATKLREKTSCLVNLLTDEKTFSASIGWEPTLSTSFVSFNVSAADAKITTPPATHQFGNVNEAAQWVLQCLQRSAVTAAG